jgi:exodeoxyribonuclease V alpha subunit
MGAADPRRDAGAVFLGASAGRSQALLAVLADWVARGWLRELDRAFAAFLATHAPDADPLLILAAALASHQLGRGHACLDLEATLLDADRSLALPPESDGEGAAGAPSTRTAATSTTTTTTAATATLPAQLLGEVDLARWTAALAHPVLVGEGPGTTPLVRVGTRLYLRRYWQHEQSVREALRARLAGNEGEGEDLAAAEAPARVEALRAALDALFEPAGGARIDWQKIACALAARSRFSIVTGGPGTGKTTTVVRLLAVLQHLAMARPGGAARPLRIRLAAPTGKAAARLNESITKAVAGLPLEGMVQGDRARADALRAAIPTQVCTVHRLLGSRPGTRRFVHDERRRLPVDVVVIDEASMLDLGMMAAVFAALPPGARLVLLGDKDQLASVEAGSVLGDLCRRADGGHYTAATARWVEAATGQAVPGELLDASGTALDQAVAQLRHSHRFSADSGIGRLAEAVNAGDAAAAARVMAGGLADLSRLPAGDERAFRDLVVEGAPAAFPDAGRGRGLPPPVGYGHYLALVRERRPALDAGPAAFDAWAAQVLAAYARFQLLCALRRGPHGVEGLNRRIEALLRDEGRLDAEQGGWYAGRPVLVTGNDYGLGLMNGDVGVALPMPAPAPMPASGATTTATATAASPGRGAWVLRVAFTATDVDPALARDDGDAGIDAGPRIRWVLPSRLRAVETAFAMTVHKSQGSEFEHAALVLPDRVNPVLTRELVYTGITRAKSWFTLAAAAAGAGAPSGDVMAEAVQARVLRVGGLHMPD